jgi:hypothetical protein
MNRPNIFTYATSELSQDAFLCWLLAWADRSQSGQVGREHEDEVNRSQRLQDAALHEAGVDFVKALLTCSGAQAPSAIETVVVHKQWKDIDVLAVVNGRYAILIEDKVQCFNSPGQLDRYLKAVKEHEKVLSDGGHLEIVPIYLKTRDQSTYEDIDRNKYRPFLRTDMLRVLRGPTGDRGICNAIFTDFKAALESVETQVKCYPTVPVEMWDGLEWTGFFMDLQRLLGGGEWAYVPNPGGGFWGFWWHFRGHSGMAPSPYLQLEYGDLCFKVDMMGSSSAASVRGWWERLEQASIGGRSEIAIERPKRLGAGRWVTVARLSGRKYMRLKEGLVDFGATVEVLKSAERLLDRAWDANPSAATTG